MPVETITTPMFLEQEVGLPSLWFEVLSHLYRRKFNPQGFVQQTPNFSHEEILPDIIMNGGHATDY